jgi:hypothetical protein
VGWAVLTKDCKSALTPVESYFSASILQCPECGQRWLSGYHEDLAHAHVEAEWGDRTWIRSPLSADEIAVIDEHLGAGDLDIDAFHHGKVAVKWLNPEHSPFDIRVSSEDDPE